MESPYFQKESGIFGNIKEFIKTRNSTLRNFFLINYDIDLEDFKFWDKEDYNWDSFIENIYFQIRRKKNNNNLEKEENKEEEKEENKEDGEINGS